MQGSAVSPSQNAASHVSPVSPWASGSGGSMKDLCIQGDSQRVSDLLDGMPPYAGPHTQL